MDQARFLSRIPGFSRDPRQEDIGGSVREIIPEFANQTTRMSSHSFWSFFLRGLSHIMIVGRWRGIRPRHELHWHWSPNHDLYPPKTSRANGTRVMTITTTTTTTGNTLVVGMVLRNLRAHLSACFDHPSRWMHKVVPSFFPNHDRLFFFCFYYFHITAVSISCHWHWWWWSFSSLTKGWKVALAIWCSLQGTERTLDKIIPGSACIIYQRKIFTQHQPNSTKWLIWQWVGSGQHLPWEPPLLSLARKDSGSTGAFGILSQTPSWTKNQSMDFLRRPFSNMEPWSKDDVQYVVGASRCWILILATTHETPSPILSGEIGLIKSGES